MSASGSRGKDREFVFRLPLRALLVAGIALLAGLLLFVIVWLSGRGKQEFYTVQPADKAADLANQAPLPEPLATGGDASGMPTADADADAEAPAATDATAQSPAMPQALPETADTAAPAAAPASTAAPAGSGSAALDRSIPQPLAGHSPAPGYPPAALRKGETGSVLLRAQVDAQGSPQGLAIVRSSGSRDLDRAAMEAVRKWKFQPALDDGEPVAGTVDIPFEFNLQR
ncbi:MAG: energy transducer TonB [Pseudoxanthomonas sp.]